MITIVPKSIIDSSYSFSSTESQSPDEYRTVYSLSSSITENKIIELPSTNSSLNIPYDELESKNTIDISKKNKFNTLVKKLHNKPCNYEETVLKDVEQILSNLDINLSS